MIVGLQRKKIDSINQLGFTPSFFQTDYFAKRVNLICWNVYLGEGARRLYSNIESKSSN